MTKNHESMTMDNNNNIYDNVCSLKSLYSKELLEKTKKTIFTINTANNLLLFVHAFCSSFQSSIFTHISCATLCF